VPWRPPILPAHGSLPHADRDRLRRRRSGSVGRLYDTVQWRVRTRARILSRDPFCKIVALCEGRALSTDVDHIIRAEEYVDRHSGDARYFFDENNLQGACHACHAAKTARGG
jgi:5-methylcytosine-specific restriction endonuclease McrA